MIKLRKKHKELDLLVKKKQHKPWEYMHIFNSKKVTTVGKNTPKNITYTHTILLLVIYIYIVQTSKQL